MYNQKAIFYLVAVLALAAQTLARPEPFGFNPFEILKKSGETVAEKSSDAFQFGLGIFGFGNDSENKDNEPEQVDAAEGSSTDVGSDNETNQKNQEAADDDTQSKDNSQSVDNKADEAVADDDSQPPAPVANEAVADDDSQPPAPVANGETVQGDVPASESDVTTTA